MRRDEKNLYRVDDVLLRAGGLGLLAVLAVGVCFVLVVVAEAEPPVGGAVASALGEYGVAYFVALLCPLAALRIGFAIRRREQRSAAIWRLLRQHAELSVANLVGNSDFDAADVERTVKLLNNRGLGHYVWDRQSGKVQDGRLHTMQLHVDKCEACGGSVSLEVPLGFSEIPDCPYCGDPVSVDVLEARRHEALDALRVDERESCWTDRSKVPFSIPIFVILMMTFWPAGLLYAWYKWYRAR